MSRPISKKRVDALERLTGVSTYEIQCGVYDWRGDATSPTHAWRKMVADFGEPKDDELAILARFRFVEIDRRGKVVEAGPWFYQEPQSLSGKRRSLLPKKRKSRPAPKV